MAIISFKPPMINPYTASKIFITFNKFKIKFMQRRLAGYDMIFSDITI
jgi:hypothetical protein